MITRNLPIKNPDGCHTIVVCGIERGGTSMVAATLHHLGIDMGDNLDATYEDHELAIKIRTYAADASPNALNELKHLIATRNERNCVWGFKVPNIFLYPEVLGLLRQPILVCIFRDTVANSERISYISNRNVLEVFDAVQNLQSRLAGLFKTAGAPVLAISYENSLVDAAAFVDGLISALQFSVSDTGREAAISAIRPSPADYLKVAGPAEIMGHVEGFECGDLAGWLIKSTDEFEQVSAEIAVDGQVVDIVEAGEFRSDLWMYCSSDLNHGFRWRIPRRYYDSREHLVTVNVQGTDAVRIANQTTTISVPDVFGALEEFVDGTLRGWVYRWRGFSSGLWVSIEVDDRFVSRIQANYPRDDLEPLGFHGAGGLAFPLAKELLDGQDHRVSMRVEGQPEAAIRGSPRFLRFPSRERRGVAGRETMTP